jgi:phosphodiesterase/alkaline phosphatase D-like protein
VRDLSRRDVLKLAGATAALASTGISCGDNDATKSPGDSHGVALFEPAPDGFLLSAWAATAKSFAITLADATGAVLATQSIDVGDNRQAVLAITGLEPRTGYQVTAIADDGALCGPHVARTAPAIDDTQPVRVAIGADLDPIPYYASDLLQQLIAANPDVLLSIGDFPYTDDGPIAQTVDEYRQRNALLRTYEPMRAVMQAMPLVSIYDDHEFRNNWDAMFVAEEPDRYAAAMQVWDEFFPLREVVGEVRYRNLRWGANLEIFVLDCRRFRSADAAPDDANKTMIGATQKAWLYQVLAASTATFKLILSSVPLDYGIGNDHWAAFSTEREEILGFIAAQQLPGVLFVSGDQHYFAAYTHSHGLREFQIGPLGRGLGTVGPDGPGVLYRNVQYNFGLIDIDGDRLTMSGVGADGTVFYKETMSADALAPQA